MLYNSFQRTFVTNSAALLAEGQTVDALAVGQIGILDAKTYKAVTAPTYAKNKALKVVWGTPNINLGDFGGAPNENEYTELIKGKLIKGFRAYKAQKPQTPLYSIGWSGDVADANTLFASAGESRELFLRLTGNIIDRNYSTQGLVRVLNTVPDCVDECSDICEPLTSAQIVKMTKQLVKDINADKELRKYIRAKALISCNPATTVTETTCYRFKVVICDTGDDRSLGVVQGQYPNDKVFVSGRDGSNTTYTVIRNVNTAPANFSVTGTYVPFCPTCPSGFTLIPSAKVFQVQTPEGTLSAAVATAFTGETSITQVNAGPQFVTYTVTFPTTTADADVITAAETAGYTAIGIGIQTAICQSNTAITATWAADGTLKRQSKTYSITLADSVCGTNRLAEIQAAYPALVVTLPTSTGNCVHTYQTTVASDCYELDCAVPAPVYVKPQPFEGADWEEVLTDEVEDGAVCKTGILIESSFFFRGTNDCTYDAFPYDNDVVQVLASNHSPNFNAKPCVKEWVFRQIRQAKYPQGHGAWLQHVEQDSKGYDSRLRNFDAVKRGIDGYSLQADPTKYYDQYTLEFDVKYQMASWGEVRTYSNHLDIFVPEGKGDAIERAFTSYLSSAGIEENGAVI